MINFGSFIAGSDDCIEQVVYMKGDSNMRFRHSIASRALVSCCVLFFAASTIAGDLERRQAKRMHDRLAGVPPTAALEGSSSGTLLDLMEQDIVNGDPDAAAYRAIENPSFYNVTLKNFAMPWTNRDQSAFEPLNDYVATIIGMVRDDVPFTQVLSADLLYVGDTSLSVPGYSMTDNAHYEALEQDGIDLKENLVATTQSDLTGLSPEATAGVMTTRAAAKAFFVDGTNRAMFRFTLMNHLCTDLEQLKDNSRSPDRIRQDVSRSPGGDSRLFMNNCVACHSGMDPMAQAFAYYDFDYVDDVDSGQIVFSPGVVQEKYTINENNFKQGYVTQNNHWNNYWRKGPNSSLGWGTGSGGGDGAKSLGLELAGSEAFAQCQVKKVFKAVCLREPEQRDSSDIVGMLASFKVDGNLKAVFAKSAVACKGE